MSRLSIKKEFRFEAAHHLPDHSGKCKVPHGHGYRLIVEVFGQIKEVSPSRGMVIDFSDLTRIINNQIIDVFDHTDLNNYFVNPTAENMVLHFVALLENAFSNKSIRLESLELYETEKCSAIWRRK